MILGPRDREPLRRQRVLSLREISKVTFIDEPVLQSTDAGQLATEIIGHLNLAGPRWWFHLDLDVLSTKSLSAVDYQQPGGRHAGAID